MMWLYPGLRLGNATSDNVSKTTTSVVKPVGTSTLLLGMDHNIGHLKLAHRAAFSKKAGALCNRDIGAFAGYRMPNELTLLTRKRS